MNRRISYTVLIGVAGLLFTGSVFYLGFSQNRQNIEEIKPLTPNATRFLIPIIIIFSLGIFFATLMFWYYFPEIRPKRKLEKIKKNASPFEVISYISSEDEVLVLSTLKRLDNQAYQFELAKITELSKMRLHRIINVSLNGI